MILAREQQYTYAVYAIMDDSREQEKCLQPSK